MSSGGSAHPDEGNGVLDDVGFHVHLVDVPPRRVVAVAARPQAQHPSGAWQQHTRGVEVLRFSSLRNEGLQGSTSKNRRGGRRLGTLAASSAVQVCCWGPAREHRAHTGCRESCRVQQLAIAGKAPSWGLPPSLDTR